VALRSFQSALTVKLRGRPTTADRRRGPAISTGSHGAKQITHHGPLQRLLDGTRADLALINGAETAYHNRAAPAAPKDAQTAAK